jgi:hypothetical protein
MNELTRQRLPRLGVVILAMTAMLLSIGLVLPLDEVAWFEWLILAVFVATGIGLVARQPFARVIAALGLVAGIVLGARSQYQLWSELYVDWNVTTVLAVANAIVTTLLGFWLGVRALLVVVGRARSITITARLVGAMIFVVAANHLWLAHLYGIAWRGGFSINFSGQGTQLFGFPGWPLWHAAALLTALVMVAGPRRMLAPATYVLMVLAYLLVPLMAIALIAIEDGFDLPLFVFTILVTLLVAYLARWLRAETQGIGAATAMNG